MPRRPNIEQYPEPTIGIVNPRGEHLQEPSHRPAPRPSPASASPPKVCATTRTLPANQYPAVPTVCANTHTLCKNTSAIWKVSTITLTFRPPASPHAESERGHTHFPTSPSIPGNNNRRKTPIPAHPSHPGTRLPGQSERRHAHFPAISTPPPQRCARTRTPIRLPTPRSAKSASHRSHRKQIPDTTPATTPAKHPPVRAATRTQGGSLAAYLPKPSQTPLGASHHSHPGQIPDTTPAATPAKHPSVRTATHTLPSRLPTGKQPPQQPSHPPTSNKPNPTTVRATTRTQGGSLAAYLPKPQRNTLECEPPLTPRSDSRYHTRHNPSQTPSGASHHSHPRRIPDTTPATTQAKHLSVRATTHSLPSRLPTGKQPPQQPSHPPNQQQPDSHNSASRRSHGKRTLRRHTHHSPRQTPWMRATTHTQARFPAGYLPGRPPNTLRCEPPLALCQAGPDRETNNPSNQATLPTSNNPGPGKCEPPLTPKTDSRRDTCRDARQTPFGASRHSHFPATGTSPCGKCEPPLTLCQAGLDRETNNPSNQAALPAGNNPRPGKVPAATRTSRQSTPHPTESARHRTPRARVGRDTLWVL